ncbi:MAG: PLP-dependent cysteine synthase family protein [Gemmatimonadota bacterium]|nr:PLP-dependent cysteine synthase family protein [Gemmatimonadota bacterium]
MTASRVGGLDVLVGNTPLLAILCRFRGVTRVIHAKSENLNMTGSVKDRMALHILRRAQAAGHLAPGALLIEATSGNTGISFAAIGRAMGYRVAIFMPEWMSAERINLIRSFGAEIHLVSAEQGGFLGAIAQADALAAVTEGAFLPHQFSNHDNSAAHEATTGPEIIAQLRHIGRRVDAFVAGVGTGGTVMGTGRHLRSHFPAVRVHPLEPASSPTLSVGHRVGKHRIQGISDEFIPAIVDLEFLDEVLAVDDGDAILMAQKLACDLGLAVGISSGANFLGALLAQERLGVAATVVTVFSDSNKKYLSTDLLREEPVQSHYLAPHIELLGFEVAGRSCAMCSDPVEPEAMVRTIGAVPKTSS